MLTTPQLFEFQRSNNNGSTTAELSEPLRSNNTGPTAVELLEFLRSNTGPTAAERIVDAMERTHAIYVRLVHQAIYLPFPIKRFLPHLLCFSMFPLVHDMSIF